MTRRLWITLPLMAAALTAGGCGSDDDSSSTAATTPATTSTSSKGLTGELPKNCATNADARVTALDVKADTGTVKINKIGTVSFVPSKDFAGPGKDKIKKGSHVYLTYTNGKATCLLPFSP